jgi:hypothetical protein
VTYPLLFAIGIALTPWDALVATLRPEILITIVSTVGTIMGTGFFVGRWVNLYPIESAIVNACHSGQGGTGDVAILTAANRMELMPFAQIATAHRWCDHSDDRHFSPRFDHLTGFGRLPWSGHLVARSRMPALQGGQDSPPLAQQVQHGCHRREAYAMPGVRRCRRRRWGTTKKGSISGIPQTMLLG